ncbi:hypothetical protein GCM10027290_53950 [Micromonospora sonneratiae]
MESNAGENAEPNVESSVDSNVDSVEPGVDGDFAQHQQDELDQMWDAKEQADQNSIESSGGTEVDKGYEPPDRDEGAGR